MFQVSDLDMLHKLQDKARTVRAMIYDRAVGHAISDAREAYDWETRGQYVGDIPFFTR